MAEHIQQPADQARSAVFGATIHEAIRQAAFRAHRGGGIVATDHLIGHLVALRNDDVRRLIAWVPELAEATRYSSRSSPHDGRSTLTSSPAITFEVEATLREVAWRTTRLDRRPTNRTLMWTDGLQAALGRALDEAHAAGVTRANAAHLVLAALADPANRAVRRYPHTYATIVARLTGDRLLAENGEAHPRLVTLIARSRAEGDGRWSRRLRRRLTERLDRIIRYSPLRWEVQDAQCRYAIRLHHGTITVAHTILALLDVEDRLTAYRLHLPGRYAGRNTAGKRLVEFAVTIDDVISYARRVGDDVELADPTSIGTRLGASRWGDPLWSRAVIAAEERADAVALAARHPDTGTTHLLVGMLDEARAETVALLRAVGADVDTLAERIHDDINHIPPAWPEQ